MGFGFRKSIKIAPGVRFNLGSRSMGLSFGGRGLRYSINSRTGSRATVSLPGTGLSYSVGGGSRRSYRSHAYKRKNDLVRLQKEMKKSEELQQAKHEVELFENQIEMIKSIHKECDDSINWEEIRQSTPPFNQGEKGPKEKAKILELENFKPNFFQKLIKSDEKKRTQLQEKIVQAAKEDQDDYTSWKELVALASKITSGDTDEFLNVIEEMSPLDDLSDFGSGFEFIIHNPSILEVEFDVQSENVIPKESKSLTQTGKLSVKQMTKTSYFDIYQDYVCSCVLRISRDMFAILPFDHIYIHAMDTQLNTTTGHTDQVTILSVKIERTSLNRLNFETIDCSDSMQNFKHNMKFLKTAGFKPVEKIQMN
ncbi:DUF4236 domain-containing protein [Paenibacillus planticolens]|uniref:DUF4236 domain-containing protein n=1 Tax=Paenibacillus planticolens TaxID=2654976 RepID=A0ABX1ZT39_9BACL|nr:DUF4236 domain-containing protein [Paenibacillus planticolens]NOV03220.1 DUF4236 domain-containing protein [Paenibacillus planticolens]